MKEHGCKRIIGKPERMRSGFASEKVQIIRGFHLKQNENFIRN